MKIQFFLPALILCTLTGCGHMSMPIYPAQVQKETVVNYKAGEIGSANTGEAMITRAYDVPRSVLTFLQKRPLEINGLQLPAGERWEHTHNYRGSCGTDSILVRNRSSALLVNKLGHAACDTPAFIFDKPKNQSELLAAIPGVKKGAPLLDPLPNRLLPVEDGDLRDELLYLGRDGDVLRLRYREFREWSAHPDFYQDLSYNLSESKEIAFRDIKLKILSATNTSISFKVISLNSGTELAPDNPFRQL